MLAAQGAASSLSRARTTAIRRAGTSLDARPKMRLAEEYDAAQERGEVATRDDPSRIYCALNGIVKRDNDGNPAVRS